MKRKPITLFTVERSSVGAGGWQDQVTCPFDGTLDWIDFGQSAYANASTSGRFQANVVRGSITAAGLIALSGVLTVQVVASVYRNIFAAAAGTVNSDGYGINKFCPVYMPVIKGEIFTVITYASAAQIVWNGMTTLAFRPY